MKKIRFTGGVGFIGSNLMAHFLEKGYEAGLLDNFTTGYRHNIAAHEANPRLGLIEGDIRNNGVIFDAKACLERNLVDGRL